MAMQGTMKGEMRAARVGRWVGVALVLALGLLALSGCAQSGSGVGGLPDPSAIADPAINWLKKAFVIVILAEIAAVLIYGFAFFTQSLVPELFQAFQGGWVKKAVLVGIAVPFVLGILFAMAQTYKGGFP
jgi:hypothetical protein